MLRLRGRLKLAKDRVSVLCGSAEQSGGKLAQQGQGFQCVGILLLHRSAPLSPALLTLGGHFLSWGLLGAQQDGSGILASTLSVSIAPASVVKITLFRATAIAW